MNTLFGVTDSLEIPLSMPKNNLTDSLRLWHNLILCLCLTGCGHRTQPHQDNHRFWREIEKNGVVMTARVNSKNSLEHPVPVTITLENKGQEEILYTQSFSAGLFRLELFNSFMKPVELTEYGIALIGGQDLGSFYTKKLEPNKTIEYKYNLASIFMIEEPGRYFLNIWRDINDVHPGQVKPIRLEIKQLPFDVTRIKKASGEMGGREK